MIQSIVLYSFVPKFWCESEVCDLEENLRKKEVKREMEGYCFAVSLAGRPELVLGALVIFLLAVNQQAIRSLNYFTSNRIKFQ
jgi:hypothetical protein